MSYRDHKSLRRGFTLVELVIVVLIIGILTAGAAPKFTRSLRRVEADAACLRVKADINLARQTAISRSADQFVKFTVGSGIYTLPGLRDPNHPDKSYSVNLADGAKGAIVASTSFANSGLLQFDRYGQPSSAGAVTVSASGITKTVAVDAASEVTIIP